MKTKNNITLTHAGVEPPEAAAAYSRVLPEIEAWNGVEERPNMTIPRAVGIALGAATFLKTIEGRLAALPEVDLDQLNRLGDYALALWHADGKIAPSATRSQPRKALLDEARVLKQRLVMDARALALRGLVDAARVDEIRAGSGHLDTADDLRALAALFSENWAAIKQRTAVTPEEITRASALATQIVSMVATERPATGDAMLTPVEIRNRALSLLSGVYEQARRAVTFLRWDQGDADSLLPSLRKKSRARKAAPAPVVSAPQPTPTPQTPGPSPSAVAPAAATSPAITMSEPSATQPRNGGSGPPVPVTAQPS